MVFLTSPARLAGNGMKTPPIARPELTDVHESNDIPIPRDLLFGHEAG